MVLFYLIDFKQRLKLEQVLSSLQQISQVKKYNILTEMFAGYNFMGNDCNLQTQTDIASEQRTRAKQIPNSFGYLSSSGSLLLTQQQKRWLHLQFLEKVKTQTSKECKKQFQQYCRKQDLSILEKIKNSTEYSDFLKQQLRQCFSTPKHYQKVKNYIKALQTNQIVSSWKKDQIKFLKLICAQFESRNCYQIYKDYFAIDRLLNDFYQKKPLVQNLERILFKFRFDQRIKLKLIDHKQNKQISSLQYFNCPYQIDKMYFDKNVFNKKEQIQKDFVAIEKIQFDLIVRKIQKKNKALPSSIQFFSAIYIFLQKQTKKMLQIFRDSQFCYILGTAWYKLIQFLQQNQPVQYSLSKQFYRNNNFGKKSLMQKKRPRGLQNLGNTCFLNSGLQCLHKTKFLTQFFHGFNQKQSFQDIIFLNSYKQLIQELDRQDCFPFAPKNIKRLIAERNCLFQGYKQHDCSELISSVIDNLHKALNSVKIKENVIIDQKYKDEEDLYQNYKRRDEARMNSIMDDIFFGRFRTSYHCSQCEKEMVLFQKFSIIYLPIPFNSQFQKKQSLTLNSCISKFQQEDIMQGSSSWTCHYCKSTKRTIRKMKIYKTNKILIFCLKRFQDNLKIHSTIKYPSSLDVKQLGLLGSEYQGKKYQLYAVVNHFGSLNFGHYTAYCRVDNNEWYEFNDSSTYQISKNEVLSQSNAYLLFYELQYK